MLVMRPQSAPFGEHLLNSFPTPRGRRAAEFAALREKIQAVQSKMSAANHSLDRVENQQKEMKRSAVQIAREQDTLKLAFKEESKRQKKAAQAARIITADQSLIASTLSSILQIWSRLSKAAVSINQDQIVIGARLDVVDDQVRSVQKQVKIIHHQKSEIKKNLLLSAEKLVKAQQHAQQVKENIETINEMDQDIEKTKREIEEAVRLMTDDPKMKEGTQVTPVGFLAALINKIKQLAAWVFKVAANLLTGGGIHVKNWMTNTHIQTSIEAMKHPASWMLAGALACAAIQQTAFSLACLTLEGAMMYYKWNSGIQST